jgi:uncharacterized protein YndB with AHSA1/START domain/catechol 2,3-dioxygenase-like lactoylglutathione lyase family enzyme
MLMDGSAAESIFVYETYVRTTPEKLWRTLTTNEAWNRCWMGARFESDWKAGSPWRVVSSAGLVFDSGTVLESIPAKKLVLDWRNDWKPEFKAEGPSRCVYEIEPVGTSVKLTVSHSIGRAGSPFIASVSDAWPMVVSNLKSLLETGEVALVGNPRHGAEGESLEAAGPKVIFGNHASVLVPRQARDAIRRFYCDILGGRIAKADPERDFIRLGDDFYVVLYGDVPDQSEFLRTARSVWLEIKSDDVEEMRRRILASGLVRQLEVPDPHLYFQVPGGQCMRLVGIDEDLSFYEGAADGTDVAKIKKALAKEARA